MLWTLFEIFLNFHDAAFLLSIPTKQLEKQTWVKKSQLILYYMGTACFFCLFNLVTEFSPISAYVLIVPSIIYVVSFFQGSIPSRLFWGVFPYALLICIDISTSIVVMETFKVTLDKLFVDSAYRFLMVVSARIFIFLFWRLLLKQKSSFSSLFPYGLLAGICVTIVFLTVGMMLWIDPVINQLLSKMESLILLFALFCLVMLIFMTYRTISQTKEKYALSFVKSYTRTHDFRNKVLKELQPLWSLRYKDNLMKEPKYRAAFSFLDEMISNNVKTGNEYVDAVLLLHESEAFDSGILLSVQGAISAINPIKIGDICFMLDQLLNSTVQKMRAFSDEEAAKIIILTIIDSQDKLILELECPSWRNDKAFDLSLVLDLAKRYKGSVTSSVVDLYRTTTVSLPYPSLVSIK